MNQNCSVIIKTFKGGWEFTTVFGQCFVCSKIKAILRLKIQARQWSCQSYRLRRMNYFKNSSKEFSNPSNSSSHISLRIICIRKNLLVWVSFILDLSPFIIIKVKDFETEFWNPMTQETFFVYVLVCHQTTRRFTPDWCQMNIFMPFRQKQEDDWLPPKTILNKI